MIRITAKDSKNSVNNLEYIPPEIWKPIDGYDKMYEVSNKGRIRSWKRRFSKNKHLTPVVLSQHVGSKGYKRVNLCKNGANKNHKVHRLVAKAFVKNPENKPQVNHKDGDKFNNLPKNLEWSTNTENMRHAYREGIRSNKGENSSTAILVEEDIKEIRQLLDKGVYQKDIAKKFGVKQVTISAISTGRNWSHV